MNTRNDHLGQVQHRNGILTVYASGLRGPEVRANGQGGSMARGYHARDHADQWHGPFLTRKAAWKAMTLEPNGLTELQRRLAKWF
jgi:hypothetical protein